MHPYKRGSLLVLLKEDTDVSGFALKLATIGWRVEHIDRDLLAKLAVPEGFESAALLFARTLSDVQRAWYDYPNHHGRMLLMFKEGSDMAAAEKAVEDLGWNVILPWNDGRCIEIGVPTNTEFECIAEAKKIPNVVSAARMTLYVATDKT